MLAQQWREAQVMSLRSGARVEVYWRRYSRYFKGVVGSISEAGVYSVAYDDGDRREYTYELDGERHPSGTYDPRGVGMVGISKL